MKPLHFTVKSPSNFVRLCSTILFEKSNQYHELGYVWHKVFDGVKGDEHFMNFMLALYPKGCTIGEDEIHCIMNKAIRFLETDESCLEIKADYDKRRFRYYVYFAPLHKTFECGFAKHEDTVIKILQDFFGSEIIDYDSEKLKRFIIMNFEIKSDNSSIDTIVADIDYIKRCIYFKNRREGV